MDKINLQKIFSKKNAFKVIFLFILALITAIFLWQYLNTYLKRSKAAATSVTLSLIPSTLSFNNQEAKEIQLITQFKDGSASERIDYFKAKVNFPKDNLELVDLPTIDPSSLDLSSVRVIQVDGPVTANANGVIVIELGASLPGSGPATNSRPIVAKIKFKGKLPITNGTITINNVEIVNNVSAPITQITKNNTTFSVTTAKSCSVSVSGDSVTFSGSNAPAGNNVRLWLTRQDKAAINPAPSNQGVYIEGAPLNYTGYNVDNCNINARGTCSKTYTVWGSLPAGDYYFHCDIKNEPGKCSGQPFCDYEHPPMPGGKDCTALGYRSCSNNDNAVYTKSTLPKCESVGGVCVANPGLCYGLGTLNSNYSCGAWFCCIPSITSTPTPIKKLTPTPIKKLTPTPTKKVTLTPTKTPTSKPGTPTPTKKPTPTINLICKCTNNVCSTDCSFDYDSQVTNYTKPPKCNLSNSLFSTPPTAQEKNGWCKSLRVKGDADGSGVINNTDYLYYVTAVNGGKIPVTVNPDFNGDGEVGQSDRAIIMKSL